MEIDWRSLLSSIRIEWIDRGPNTSPGNINIKCPWCNTDPSYHLSLATAREAYYCYRDPNRHSGRGLIGLLMKLGQSRDAAIKLLNYYRRGQAAPAREPSALPTKPHIGWDRFAPAYESPRCLEYLAGRGFRSPRHICERYDLRVAWEGAWAKRLLIPLHLNGEVVSWTGRDMRGSSTLKYKMQEVEGYMSFYSPDGKKPRRETCIIVEGPLDALKLASACHGLPIITVALCGKAIGAQKLIQLRQLSEGCAKCLVALDADVPMSQSYQIIRELAAAIKARYIGRARLPPGIKDPGELELEGIPSWIQSQLAAMTKTSVAEKEYK